MKKQILFTMAIAIGLTIGSCQKEQSQLILDSVKGTARIQGKVMYDEGAKRQENDDIDPFQMSILKLFKMPHRAFSYCQMH